MGGASCEESAAAAAAAAAERDVSERASGLLPWAAEAVWFNRGGGAPWRHVAPGPWGLGGLREDDTRAPHRRD